LLVDTVFLSFDYSLSYMFIFNVFYMRFYKGVFYTELGV